MNSLPVSAIQTIVAVRRIHGDKGYLLRALLLVLWRALMARRFI